MGGFSLWVVPHGYNILMNTYKMDHIPHVTVVQNIGYPLPTKDVGKECDIAIKGDIQPLYGTKSVGVYCDVNIPTELSTHMVVWYSGATGARVPPMDKTMKGILCVADCSRPHPSGWKIII